MSSKLEIRDLGKFKWIGWRSRVARYGKSFKIGVDLKVAIGCGLSRKKDLFCYLMEENGRPVMVIYLDGKEREGEMKI